MTAVNKIDSNSTGLRFALENPDGTLPANPVWYPLEPNSYDKFGGAVKTVARNPINDTRQRKKGVVVDVDAKAGFEMDITAANTQLLMPSFMFAALRTKAESSVPSVTNAGSVYAPAANGASYFANNLLFAKGFTNSVNNGLKKVTGTPAANSVPITTALADESSLNGIISRVGHEFGAGAATIDVSGALPRLIISGVTAATGTLTDATALPANGDTVTVNGKVYTFQTVLTEVDGNVKIGATVAATMINLRNAINRNNVGVAGTDFAAATTAHPSVTATSTATTVAVSAIVWGTPGNGITTTATGTAAVWGGATLSGGTGRSMLDLGLIIGEWVCIGDDPVGMSFANSQNNGLKRVRALDNVSLSFDKSTVTMVTDAGTAKTIRVFFGRVSKNEAAALQQRQLVQFERTLGAPDTSSTAVQAEYLTHSVANTLEVQMKAADKVTAKINFESSDQETRLPVDGLKAGSRPVIADSNAFNTSSNVARLSLAAIDPTTATPTELFAFLLDINLTINNNVKANKAIKYLGSFDHSAGTFMVDTKMTAYFSSVAAIRSVRNNADVTLDLTFAMSNQGITIDLPLVVLATDGATVKQDEPIELAVTSAAATASKLDVNLNHTLLMVFWDYIPTLAA